MWIFSCFILEITKNGHFLGMDSIAFFNALFPSGSLSCPACLCDLGESQWNPWGDSSGILDTPIPEGKTLSGHHRCQSLQKHPGVCRRRLQGLLQVSVSGCFFLFCRTTNNLAKFVSPWAGHPQPQGNSCPWICSFMSGAHFLNTWRHNVSEAQTPFAQRQGAALQTAMQPFSC